MAKPFKSIKPVNPGRSAFDLSYTKLFTCDMGQLIPIMCDEMVPGDKFKVGNEIVVRFQPLVAPVLHPISVYVHYFFVPYRLLWDDTSGSWEQFITGGKTGTDASVLPRWYDTQNYAVQSAEGTLWDYLGFPLNQGNVLQPNQFPLDFPRRAYYMIWNEYYRDETLQAEYDFTTWQLNKGYQIKNRNWTKDYFTSALPWQQRGTAPALPIGGTTSAEWDADVIAELLTADGGQVYGDRVSPSATLSVGTPGYTDTRNGPIGLRIAGLNDNTVDLSLATTFNVSDLRTAVQIQRWLERNARGGIRYREFLLAHFGITVPDSRLMRPEYVGGSKAPVIVSEVLQTSESSANSPQGTMAGHGISASSEFCGEYFAQEYGVMMGIMSIMPAPMYQQGINRQWMRQSKYDFFFPEFVNLSEQAILLHELWMNNADPSHNEDIFGYQGRYDEMRVKQNMVCGKMRSDATTPLDFWHLARNFSTLPELNSSFIECVPDKRIFAVETEPGLIVSCGNLIKAIRPLPISAEPGLVDHI